MSDLQRIEEIKTVIDSMCRTAALIPLEDAQALVQEFSRMRSLMPLIDPTGYIEISETIGGHEDAARAFLAFRERLEKLKDRETE